jgi:hypothetical protein
MGKYDVVDEVEAKANMVTIRGLSAEDQREADQAIADGLVRSCLATDENERSVKAIKRYLSGQGWSCKITLGNGGRLYWRVAEKRQISDEHKARMLDALAASRTARTTPEPTQASEGASGKRRANA